MIGYATPMNVIVTGINGFVGRHVARSLHEYGHKIIGIGMQPEPDQEVSHLLEKYYAVDLSNTTEVSSINLTDVDSVINLAGLTKVGDSAGQGELYNRINIAVHTLLCEESMRQKSSPRIVAISSGSVYDPNQTLPLHEQSKLIDKNNSNEYTVSKLLMEEAVELLIQQGVDCIIARPFNHSGPGQLPGFLIPDLSEQLMNTSERGVPLLVGNLQTKRDFTDVRDVASAYVALATCPRNQLKHRIYNVCSGESVAGKTLLEHLQEAFGLTTIETQVDPKKIREHDISEIYGTYERLQKDTGWEPKIPIESMINDFVTWRKAQASFSKS